jgi:hypothetical protein
MEYSVIEIPAALIPSILMGRVREAHLITTTRLVMEQVEYPSLKVKYWVYSIRDNVYIEEDGPVSTAPT